MTKRNLFPDRHAFSLVELLAALCVVAVVAALIVAGLGVVTRRAAETKCTSNLRQIGMANMAYVTENGGVINSGRSSWGGGSRPRELWWRYNLRTYFGAADGGGNWRGDLGYCPVLVCPADDSNGGEGADGHVGESLRRSYNVNAKLERQMGGIPVRYRMQQIEFPSRVMYAMDADWGVGGNSEFVNGSSINHLNKLLPRDWHGGSVNMVFLDGGVESIAIEELYPGQSRHGVFYPDQSLVPE